MPFPVIMPALELGQETGKLVAWRKKEGEKICRGEVLLDVETDKAVVEIEASADGILAGIRLQPGQVIPVGRIIAWLLASGEDIPPDAGSAPAASKPVPAAAPEILTNSASSASYLGTAISPKARRLAKEKGIDIGGLRGSGEGGEILAADVLAAADSANPYPAAAAESSTVARRMAERTTQSWTTVPHFFLTAEVDAGPLIAARARLTAVVEESPGVRPTHTDLLLALLAQVLSKHPEMNASWAVEGIRRNPEINIAIAMAVSGGVVAAVIHHADRLSLGEISRQRKDLAERARAGRLRPAEVSGGTFTISNLGMYGVDAFSAIIVPPQAGILAIGRIADRVVPIDGQAAIRPTMTLTLSCDHRVVDGARAAIFLQHLCAAVGDAEKGLPPL